MNTFRKISCSRAFTEVELIFVILVVFLLALVILPGMFRPHGCRLQVNCVNNLKQVGLAFRLWSGDNGDKFPMAYAGNPSYPLINHGNAWSVPGITGQYQYTAFEAMSNELSTPKVIVCPQDKRTAATNFTTDLNNSHVSFFVGLDSDETRPQSFLAGDRDLSNGQPMSNGLFSFQTNQNVVWTKALHNKMGNMAFGDGSVQQLSNRQIKFVLAGTGLATNRLLFP